MKKTLIILTVVGAGLMTSCRLYKPIYDLQPMPPAPEYQQFTRKPIIKSIGDDFLVSDQFVVRATQEHEHNERVSKWKVSNSIR